MMREFSWFRLIILILLITSIIWLDSRLPQEYGEDVIKDGPLLWHQIPEEETQTGFTLISADKWAYPKGSCGSMNRVVGHNVRRAACYDHIEGVLREPYPSLKIIDNFQLYNES